MIRIPVSFPENRPLTRTEASQIVRTASRYTSQLMIEQGAQVVNAKSILGLLSISAQHQGDTVLIADGPDEETAAMAMKRAMPAT